MNFASDNAGPMHPKVREALIAADEGYQMPYGNDTIMDEVRERLRDIFEAPNAAVYLVATGTAANALALATFAKPWDAIFCHKVAHVEEDECGAPEFYSGGAKLTLVNGASGRMDPDALRTAIESTGNKGVHGVQRGPVTLTQATELGTLYSLDELQELTSIAKGFGMRTHLDGARFANAAASLGCSAAEMTWKAGIDVVSFGGTKNGCAGVEAVVFFDPEQAWEFELRRKRGAHLFSKHRYLSAQMLAYLTDDLWLSAGAQANQATEHLAKGLKEVAGIEFAEEPQANIIFAQIPRRLHAKAKGAGAQYYLFPFDTSLEGDGDEPILCRLVCDWSKTEADIDRLLSYFHA